MYVVLPIVELNATLLVAPLQIVCADADPTGVAFTVAFIGVLVAEIHPVVVFLASAK